MEKRSQLVDDSGSYSDATNFGKADCDRVCVQFLTEARQVAALRSDDIIWDFKNLSVREIEPPTQDSSVLEFAIFPR